SNKLLTINIWKRFQDMFVEEGMAIYEDNKITENLILVQTLKKKETEIYVEVEHARLTCLLSKIKENDGKINEAADILQ
ncbi:6748_t:CDS:2, partial [Cetraspora pellucida]